ncbi:MAG: ABC transporter ATP-binding protein [Phycisphaerae bacterium]|jgi:ABC-type dipeptide/oligopeptide/nickel transport system ATPase component
MTSEALLRVHDLSVRFAGSSSPAVEHASLTLHAERTIAVVGESGSGKTVTALAAMGLLPRDASCGGEITLRRRSGERTDLLRCDERTLRAIRGAEIAMIFQEPMTSLNPVMTIGEQLEESLLLHRPAMGRHARREACERALADVGIGSPGERLRQFPHEFSGGMRQRVMIAMALACEPSVLIADEPTTALDAHVRGQILDLIDSIRVSRRLGVLLITHDLGVVRRRADAACVMFRGRVVEYGPTMRVLESPLHPYTAALLACSPGPWTRGMRLTTIPSHPVATFAGATPAACEGRRPWWPGTGAGSLVRVEADRWVCVQGPAEASEAPDVDVQGASRGEPRCAC